MASTVQSPDTNDSVPVVNETVVAAIPSTATTGSVAIASAASAEAATNNNRSAIHVV